MPRVEVLKVAFEEMIKESGNDWFESSENMLR